MRGVRALGFASVLVGLVLFAVPALADEAARARFHFERGLRLYRAGQLDGAIREFIAVRQLSDSPQPLFNLAVCFDQAGAPDKAYFYFASYLEASETTPEQAELARRALARLRSKVAVLRILSDPPGAEVYIDRKEHGSYGRTPLVVPATAGRHRVWLAKPGFREAEVEVKARLGRETERRVDLEPVVGILEVAVEPPGEVLVLDMDGATVARGASPLEARLQPGAYVVEASAVGHRTQKEVLRLLADERVEHRPSLEPLPPPTGTLTVTSNRLGALVEVDGAPVGFAPLVLDDLRLGPRELRVSYPGDQPWSGTVELEPTTPGYLTATLEAPPEIRRWDGTWVVGGVGVSALLAAAVTGGLALDAQSEYDARYRDPDGSEIASLRDRGVALADATNGLLVAGSAALVTAVVLYFVTAYEDERRSRASISW